MLLCCIPFSSALAANGPVAADQVPAIVAAAARQQVARWAEGNGLSEPQFTVSVVPGTRPLTGCSGPVTAQGADTRTPARMRFVAVCAGANGWRYEFIVRAQVSARIAVMANDLAAGKVLADEDVLLERHDVSAITDSIGDPQEAVGMSGKRSLRAGEVLRKNVLMSPTLVKRGEPVRIIARHQQIEVTMAGDALDAGGRGDTIRVRNSNGTVIRARVSGAATVEPVTLPVTASSPSE
ncbi:flagellar basal body P-ring formation chaperone FlgA [Duganella sp. P38]|uniref:flagellar basal body P-ring formation chaperone FlgA n=1 Tax=Duganella sp. P38 TaxID=3423949 RepID=UPI003D79E7AD